MATKTHQMEFLLQAQLGSSYTKTFQGAQQQLVSLQKEITGLSNLQSDISAYQKQQSAVDQTRRKLETLEEQYANIQREIQETDGFSAALQNRLLAKQLQIDNTSASLQQETVKLGQMGSALESAGVDTENLTASSNRLTSQMQRLQQEQEEAAESAQDLGDTGVNAFNALGSALMAAGVLEGLQQVSEYFISASKASMDFETAMTGVAKTTDLTDEEFAAMSDSISHMSTTMPTTAEELAGIMEAAGQLGIQKGALVDFTETMAMLGVSTNMSADEAATALARFANITGTSADNYGRLGAVIVGLGNSFATTESEITEMATRLASAGTLAGLTEPEIMALAAAMSSVGIEAEAGGTAMTQTLGAIESAVANGGEVLEQFASVAGMSADEFSNTWNTNAIEAVQAFITGIGELESKGESAVLVLDEMGLSGIRQSNMLQSMALAADQMTGAVAQANQEWQQSTALTNEASRFYDTTENKLKMMRNAYQRVSVSIGNAYNPAVKKAAEYGTVLLNGVADFVDENPAMVNAITASVGVFGLAAGALTAYTAVVNIAKAASEAFAAATGASLGPVMVVVGGLTALAGIAAGVATAMSDDVVPSVDELTQAAQNSSTALEEASAGYSDSMAQVEASADMADAYISKLEELEAAGLKTKEQQDEYHNTLVLLTELVPELSDQINLQTDEIYGGTDALKANTAAWKENAQEQAKIDYLKSVQEEYSAVMKEAADNSLQYTKAQANLTSLEEKQKAIKTEMAAVTEEYAEKVNLLAEGKKIEGDSTEVLTQKQLDLQNQLYGVEEQMAEARSGLDAYSQAMEQDQDALSAMQEEIDLAGAAWDTMIASQDGAADSASNLGEQTQAVNDVLGEVTANLDFLVEKYNEAYEAAYASVSGQYAIWDEAADIVPTSIWEINDALSSQLSYWQNYNENLDYLAQSFDQFPGLQEVVASFADGSAESINAVAGITQALKDGNYEDVQSMITDWQSLQTETVTTSDNIAEMKTNSLAAMDELVSGVETDVQNLNLSEEAAAAGKATMQSYISGLESLSGTLSAKLDWVKNQVSSALSGASTVSSGGTTTKGYASGTTSADPGFALVGEEGPELVFFHGGEQVLTAEETASLQAGSFQVTAFDPAFLAALSTSQVPAMAAAQWGGGPANVQITFEIQGDVTDSAMDRLESFRDAIEQVVLATLAENAENAKRGVYS